MKKVFSKTSDVVHLFAQQTQNEARNQSGNLFFKDGIIYSYGAHYELAKWIKNYDGETAIYINDAGYSNTTSKHINEIKQATRQYKQFLYSNINIVRELNYFADKLKTAIYKEKYKYKAFSLFASYVEYKKWKHGNDYKTFIDPYVETAMLMFDNNIYDIASKLEKYGKEWREKEKQRKQKEYDRAVYKFKNYEINSFRSHPESCLYDVVRISMDMKYIQTNMNVSIPLPTAKAFYKMIKQGREIKGYKIDNYTVIGFNDSLQIGCHYIDKDNVFEIGEKILSL